MKAKDLIKQLQRLEDDAYDQPVEVFVHDAETDDDVELWKVEAAYKPNRIVLFPRDDGDGS